MKKQLFPKEFIRSSLEHYTFRIRRKSSAIYVIILLSVGTLLAALPFISLDVTVSTVGLIGTNEQRHVLSVAVGGRILNHAISENAWVNKGDTLLELDSSEILEESVHNKSRLSEINKLLRDLVSLIADPSIPHTEMISSKYQLANLQYYSEQSHFGKREYRASVFQTKKIV